MDHLPPVWASTGAVVIIKPTHGDGVEIAVTPDAARIGCESYDDAWTTARTLAETTTVDFWFTRGSAATRARDELRLLGPYWNEPEEAADTARCANASPSRRQGAHP